LPGTAVDTSVLHVYSWPEGSLDVPHFPVTHTGFKFAVDDQTCAGPDNGNWCGTADSRVVAGWLSHGILGFMWNAGAEGAFALPYVYSVRIQASSMTLISQPPLWDTANAYLYPNVAVN